MDAFRFDVVLKVTDKDVLCDGATATVVVHRM